MQATKKRLDNSGVRINTLGEDTMKYVMRRHKAQKAKINIILILALVSLVGCTSIGPRKLVDTHQGYNDAVQLAESRELLLNIVRLRFGDPIQFLAVSQVNAQFSVGAARYGWAPWRSIGRLVKNAVWSPQ